MLLPRCQLVLVALSTLNIDNHGASMPSTLSVDMTPVQCRAARVMIDMKQPELAKAAGLGLSTVVDFEKERRVVSDAAIQALRIALENAGVEFIAENGGGEGVRLKKGQKRGSS